MTAGPRALYLHIPFCERKCEYCDFVSVAGTRGEAEYVDALCLEVDALGAALPHAVLDTVFCGGGTPGLIDPARIAHVLERVRAAFAVSRDAEVTIEVNPSSCSRERARAWRQAGFNRVSVGVQSTHAGVLSFLGRVHDAPRALGALREVREAGFDNVSADLIYAVPGLEDHRWRETLAGVLATAPDHVSCYELTVEDGTPLHRAVAAGRVPAVDAESALRQHAIAVAALGAAGLHQYEVSNFARPGFESRHNLVYWRNGEYAAAGVGAHGHLPVAAAAAFGLEPPAGAVAFRYDHGRSLRRYLEGRAARPLRVHAVEFVDEPTRRAESVMLGLRLREGVSVGGRVALEARLLADAGLVALDGDRVSTTAKGENVLNQVALRLVASGG